MADEIVTLRLADWQRRRVVLQTVGLVALAIAFTVARATLPGADFPFGPWAVGAWGVVAVSCWTVPVMLRATTTCTPTGVKADTFSGPVELTWREIDEMSIQTTPLSGTNRLLLRTASGRRIALVAPLSGRGVRSADFAEEVQTMADLWTRARSSEG